MAKRSAPDLKEEFPSGSEFVPSHDTKLRNFAELLLTTGQGTNAEEVVLIAELWAGNGVLYDSETHAQIAVWFERATLSLNLTGCDIKSGSRFGERNIPDVPTTQETKTKESTTGSRFAGAALTTGSAPWPLAADQTEEFNRQTLATTG